MITDLANLGPSLNRATDLGASRGKDAGKDLAKTGNPNGRPDASSFDQILKTTSADKPNDGGSQQSMKADSNPVSRRTDRDVRDPQATQQRRTVDSGRNEPRTAQQTKPRETENWEEPGSVQEKGQSEKTAGNNGVESENRDQVMLEFMDSMESEFGIPPQRLVEAMTKIPTKDQLASPEDSASQVIAQLDLPDDQEQKALALYVGMLAQLKMAQDPALSKAQMATAAAATAVTAPVVLNSQQRRQALNQSLDQMNSKFFMQGPNSMKADSQTLQGMQSQFAQQQQMPMAPDAMPKDQVSFGQQQAAQTEKLPPFLQNRADIQKPGPQIEDLRQQMQSVDPNSKEGQALLKSLAALSASAAALDQGVKADPKNLQALKAEQMLGNASADVAPAGAAVASGLAALGLSGGDDDDSDDFGQDSSSPDQQMMMSQASSHQSAANRTEGTSPGQFGAMMAGGGALGKEISNADNKANIQQLMNQAQYLIKKGGGEAKIQMAPEGIGQVHMKMTVLDGKVNLEMQAESKEAKKLIESSIGDLKTHLAHHQLTMDQLKVDVGNQTSTDARSQDSNQQQQMDGRQNQSKQQTRDFWSEFSGQNGGFERRSGFNDSPGVRAYGGTKREAPLTPTNSGVAAKAYAGSGKGRGLNLVA